MTAPLRIRFTGTASEFFSIWVVNLALTILTLGIYSAWAKVRTRRYFYSNLVLDGSSFQYTADPVRILIGRIIVLVVFGAYSLVGSFFPLAAGAFAVLLFFLTPWLLVRSLAFHHRYTEYRNVAFRFAGGYGEAMWVFVLLPLLVPFTLGLAYPYTKGRQHEFLVRNTRYGVEPFDFEWRARRYFGVYARAVGLALGLSVVGLGAVMAIEGGLPKPALVWASPLLLLLAAYGLVLVLATALINAGTTNLLYRQSSLGAHRFDSQLRARDLFWLYATSAAAIAVTLGLAIPWARVRIARYRADRFTLLADGDLDDFVQASDPASRMGGVASEAADAFDFGFEFGL